MFLSSYFEEETVRKDFAALTSAYDTGDERAKQFVRRQAKKT